MARFLWLDSAGGDAPAFLDLLRGHHEVDIVPQYALDDADPGRYRGIVITMHADQHHLAGAAHRLDRFVEGGGAVIFNGHVVRPFLPELSPFVPLVVRGRDSLLIRREAPHPLFDGIDPELLTFNRGVAGFYARGTNPPPQGAVVINTVGPDRLPVDWVAARPSGGRVFVHGGNDVFSFLLKPDPRGGAALRRFFDWFADVETEPCR